MKTSCSTRSPIKIDYDRSYDILYVIFGDNSSSYEDDAEVGVGLIRDMSSDEVVGLSCYGYTAKNRRSLVLDILSEYGVTAEL